MATTIQPSFIGCNGCTVLNLTIQPKQTKNHTKQNEKKEKNLYVIVQNEDDLNLWIPGAALNCIGLQNQNQ